MGKKSKNKAKANARPVGGEKLPTCTRCFTLVRTNRAATCPGCTRIFCGQCESQTFSGCFQGEECALPMRRCSDCVSGALIREEIEGSGVRPSSFDTLAEFRALFEDAVIKKPPEARPVVHCPKDGCVIWLCRPCVDHFEEEAKRTNKSQPFLSCSVCYKRRCRLCVLDSVEEKFKGFIGRCAKCFRCYCSDCTKPSFWHTCTGTTGVLCSPCYWLEKPCTNPSCPNTAGMVETQRCGDCRTARYCSKECQRAMRSTHKQECIEMKKKRERRAAAARLVAAK